MGRGHLQTGYQAYVRKAGSLVEAIRSPLPDFGCAADHVADWMSAFAGQPLMVDIFGRGPLDALAALGRAKPLYTAVKAYKLMTHRPFAGDFVDYRDRLRAIALAEARSSYQRLAA